MKGQTFSSECYLNEKFTSHLSRKKHQIWQLHYEPDCISFYSHCIVIRTCIKRVWWNYKHYNKVINSKVFHTNFMNQWLYRITELRGRAVATPASYSGGPGLKYRPWDCSSHWEFSCLSSVSPGKYLDSAIN